MVPRGATSEGPTVNSNVLTPTERAALDLVRLHAASIADLLADEAERAWGRYPTLAASYWRTSAALMRLAAEREVKESAVAGGGGVPYSVHCRSVAAMREALAAEALAHADRIGTSSGRED
jgi:hypothetical protein